MGGQLGERSRVNGDGDVVRAFGETGERPDGGGLLETLPEEGVVPSRRVEPVLVSVTQLLGERCDRRWHGLLARTYANVAGAGDVSPTDEHERQ